MCLLVVFVFSFVQFVVVVVVVFVRSLKKRTSSKICTFVLFRPIEKRSFNFLCVLGPFFFSTVR